MIEIASLILILKIIDRCVLIYVLPEERKKIQAMLLQSEGTSENVVEVEEEDDPDADSDG